MPGTYTLILLGSTFLLSALWAAVLLVLVRLREQEPDARASARSALGVELAWAVIPALIVLSVVVPALQSGLGSNGSADDSDRMADVRPTP